MKFSGKYVYLISFLEFLYFNFSEFYFFYWKLAGASGLRSVLLTFSKASSSSWFNNVGVVFFYIGMCKFYFEIYIGS